MKPAEALNIYKNRFPYKYLKMYADWLEMDPSPEREEIEKKLNENSEFIKVAFDKYIDKYNSGLEFFEDLFNSLKKLILTKETKKNNVFFRGIDVNDEVYQKLIFQKEFRINKFDSFTSCPSIAFQYSGMDYSSHPIIFVTFFPKGSHLLKVEHLGYSLHEKLTPPGNVYQVINRYEHYTNIIDKVTPVKVDVILMCLVEENGIEMKCDNSIPKELGELEYYLNKKYFEKDEKYFSLSVENLNFKEKSDDKDKIMINLIDKKNSLYFENYNTLIFDDILNNCLYEKEKGKFIYPNVIFEMNKNLEINSEFPSGYELNFSIEKNKIGKKYYLVRIKKLVGN